MRVIFTCGGTAGHINPAIAVAGEIKNRFPDTEFLFIGAEGKMEMDLVPREGYKIVGVKITNISRSISVKGMVHNIKTAGNVITSLGKARRIIKEFKPDLVVGTGGYVCYPVLKAAADMHIPTAVHESNAVPGLTTKMLSSVVDKIMVGFEESRAHYKYTDKVVVTGTPVRGEFASFTREEAKEKLGLDPEKPLVLSVWGSLGAQYMNNVICSIVPKLDGNEFNLVHSTGSKYYEGVCEKLGDLDALRSKGIDVRSYIYDMPVVMAAADLVMCRAGASTLSELIYLGKPAIIVPSPNVTNNHQEKNARVLEAAGAAKVFVESDFEETEFLSTLRSLVSDSAAIEEMSRGMKSLATDDATGSICDMLLELVK